MKLKTIAFALTLSALTLGAQAALITSFSEDDFFIEYGFTSFDSVEQTTNIVVAGSGSGSMLAGGVNSFNLSGFDQIILSGSTSGLNPSASFTIDFYDAYFNLLRSYSGYSGHFGSATTSVALTLSFEGEFALPEATAMIFTVDGEDSPFDFTFESLEAIPEPSVYVLSSLALGAVYLLRRRRTSVS